MSILFELERMERLTVDLDQLRRPVRIPVSCYKRMEGKEKGSPWCSTLDWEDCSIEEPWACLDSHRWYRTTVEIPPRLDGAHVEFLITTGREEQWDAANPQMLFYLNGKIVQGVDVKPQGNFNKSQGQCRGAVRNCHPGLQRQRARGPDNPHGAYSGG